MKKTAKIGVVMREKDSNIDPIEIQIREAVVSAESVTIEQALADGLGCIDGRNGDEVISSPGGTFLLLLQAGATIEAMTGNQLTQSDVDSLVIGYVNSGQRMYLHTDDHNMQHLQKELIKDSAFQAQHQSIKKNVLQFVLAPGQLAQNLQAKLLDKLRQAIGCGAVNKMIKDSDDYQIRRELVEEFHDSYWRGMWGQLEGAQPEQFVYKVLEGEHQEQAVVHVWMHARGEEGKRVVLKPGTMVPRIKPKGEIELFLAYEQLAAEARRQWAANVADQLASFIHPSRGAEFLHNMALRWERDFGVTAQKLGADALPAYDVVIADPKGKVAIYQR